MIKKYYAVHVGRNPGVYETWAECQAQTSGYPGAKFKSFSSRSFAEEAVKNGWDTIPAKSKEKQVTEKLSEDYIKNSLSVDAACSGNPGKMEYQCVNTETGEQIFLSKLYPQGTNNLGEFLAVVDALKYLHEKGDSTTPIYTDSVSAIAWVRNERVKTNLYRNDKTEDLFKAIDNAIEWLKQNTYSNPIIKWDTKSWGESKADFGRK